jgi:CBS domain containing-hemolysin-like protein
MIYALYPLVVVSDFFTKLFIKKKKSQSVTREEIEVLTNLGTKEGVFEKDEGKLITNILGLKNIRVKEIITPRTVVIAAQENMSLDDFLKNEEFKQFSRIPVYTESIDDCNSFVLKTDVLQELVQGHDNKELRDIKRPIIIIPENLFIYKLFDKLIREHEHISMVVDEYGGFKGLATLEDIIETILGLEIQDETDVYLDMQKLARERWKIKSKDRY